MLTLFLSFHEMCFFMPIQNFLLMFFFPSILYSFFKILLNVDKKPLCGARKQRWLVSVAWKRKKKNPSNGSHPTTKKQRRRRRQKKSKQFFKKEIFLLVLCDVLRVTLSLCVFEGKFFSFSLAHSMLEFKWVCVCWKMK